MEVSVKDQIAIITGSSSGLGASCAIELAKAGATVVVNHSNENSLDKAEKVVEIITKNGGRASTFQCDVSKEDEVKKMFEDTIKRYGTVDILVNNAGVQQDNPFLDMTLEQWNTVISINLTGMFLCAKEAIREFIKRGVDPKRSAAAGKIICMSSVHEVIPWAGHVNYASSKGGVLMFMKSLAQEFGNKKIRVNSICPGAIQTPINKAAWETQKGMEALLTLIPYNRIGQPEDVGKICVWLASDQSDYITGASIFVDGGMTVFEDFADNG